jgi:hypothetical protein
MAESKRFLLRLDPRLFDSLRRWSQDDLRSINGQIEYLLTDQARRAGRLPRQTSRRRPPPDAPIDDPIDPDGVVEDPIDPDDDPIDSDDDNPSNIGAGARRAGAVRLVRS